MIPDAVTCSSFILVSKNDRLRVLLLADAVLHNPYNLISCNVQENSMGSVLLLFWFHRGENWALERISNTVGEWLSEVSNPSLIEGGASLKHTISDWIHLQLSPQSVALVSLCPKAYAQSPLNITCAYMSQEGINQCSLISSSINILIQTLLVSWDLF